MLASFLSTFREIKIRTTASGLEFTIYNPEPKGSVVLLMVPALFWLAFAIFGVLSVAGFVSPETLSPALRAFLAFWTLVWIVGGVFFIRRKLLTACGKIEGRTDDTHLCLTRNSPLDHSSTSLEWVNMNSANEFITQRRVHRGVIIHMKGRSLILADYLHPRAARRLARALNEARESAIKKQKHAA
jgi:hypothetical protein